MAEWQPIETAPKGEDNEIVIWNGEHYYLGVWYTDHWSDEEGEIDHPILWTPIPPLPKGATDG